MLTKDEFARMLAIATKARENAFVLNSRKRGAALLTEDGKIFGGCNINSIISGLGTCAERNAVDNAVVNGSYKYKAILVISHQIDYPCGACLQYLSMFSLVNDKDFEVYVVSDNGQMEHSCLSELLPKRFVKTLKLEEIKKYNNR